MSGTEDEQPKASQRRGEGEGRPSPARSRSRTRSRTRSVESRERGPQRAAEGRGDAGKPQASKDGTATGGASGGEASKGGRSKGGKPKGQGGKGQGGKGQGGKGGGNRGRSRNRRGRGRRSSSQGSGFWGNPDRLPEARSDLRITDDPAAVPRSLGPPPLPGHEAIAEHYFTAVYDRAVTTAGALGAAGGLIDPATLAEELGD